MKENQQQGRDKKYCDGNCVKNRNTINRNT